MGYTHYWRKPAEIPGETFRAIAKDFGMVASYLEANGIPLAGGDGEGSPIIDAEVIVFNGVHNCGHLTDTAVSIPWPAKAAGGVDIANNSISGAWFAGAELSHRTCDGSCDCETMVFERKTSCTLTHEDDPMQVFDCCKTAFRPYDIAVTALLVIAKWHLGDAIKVTTDGKDAHWFDAKLSCAMTVGYGLGFQINDASELVGDTPRAVTVPVIPPIPKPEPVLATVNLDTLTIRASANDWDFEREVYCRKECAVIRKWGMEVTITYLVNALQTGKECKHYSIQAADWDRRFQVCTDLWNYAQKHYGGMSGFVTVLFCDALPADFTQKFRLGTSVRKAANTFSPFAVVKPIKHPEKWTIPHVWKAILAGQLAGTGDLVSIAKELIGDPRHWSAYSDREGHVRVNSYTRDYTLAWQA